MRKERPPSNPDGLDEAEWVYAIKQEFNLYQENKKEKINLDLIESSFWVKLYYYSIKESLTIKQIVSNL